MTFIKRADLGRPLTWDELDSNFEQVDSYAASASASASAAQTQAQSASQSAQQAETAAASAEGAVDNFKQELSEQDGATKIGSASGRTVQQEIDRVLHMPFGKSDDGVYYRPGINYESAGTSSSPETRPWYHDFRPLGTADGGDAVFSTDGCNMFFGPGAGNFTMRPLPVGSIPAGIDYNLQCSHNIAYGLQALGQLTIGYKNTAIGTNAFRKLTSGHGNTATGRDCGHELTTGNDNTFYGFTAGQLMSTGSYNCIYGVSASYNNVDGTGNTVNGRRAGFQQTAGDYNTLYGEQAGFGLVTGSYNTFIGKCTVSTGLTQGDSNLVLGSRVTGLQDESRQIIIADGAGNKTLEVHKDTAAVVKKASYLDLPSYETTAFNAAATDGQVTNGSTLLLRSLANTATSVTQVVFQSRTGQPYSRIVSYGAGSSQMVFITDNVEKYRINTAGHVVPGVDNTYNYGASTLRWGASYVSKRFYTATLFDGVGSGSPEGVLTGAIGSTYRRTDGGTGTSFYVKESGTGNTGWVAK